MADGASFSVEYMTSAVHAWLASTTHHRIHDRIHDVKDNDHTLASMVYVRTCLHRPHLASFCTLHLRRAAAAHRSGASGIAGQNADAKAV